MLDGTLEDKYKQALYRGNLKNLRYTTGERVEAKCQKASAPEYNAWFEATIISFNPENGLYTIKFDGYAFDPSPFSPLLHDP